MNRKLVKIMKNLTPETKSLISGILDSPIELDLLNFYQANPFSIHTARGLANIVGRQVEQVFEAAEALSATGVLKKVCENGDFSSIYSYEPTSEYAELLKAIAELHEEDHKLLDELHELIKSETTLI